MAYNTIKLKKFLDVIEEYIAAGTITPGMLLEYTSAGKVQAHSTAAGNAYPMFALEDELQGNGIADDYSALDPVQCWLPHRGDQVYAFLKAGESVSPGDLLESSGDGYFQKHVVDSTGDYIPNALIAEAMETLDLSGSGAVTTRLVIRII